MIGQGDIVSAEPPQRIARMGRLIASDPALIEALARGDRCAINSHPGLRAEIDSYIAKFGDRCTEELKLESITLDENPQPRASNRPLRPATARASIGSIHCWRKAGSSDSFSSGS
jgi:hypothetical protein